MPELPEVETVKRQLNEQLKPSAKITSVDFLSPALRTPLHKKYKTLLKEKTLISITRRAKYLLFQFDEASVLSHLGMTGDWSFQFVPNKKHQHIRIHWSDGQELVYTDPRRFGVFEVFKNNGASLDPRITRLGPEPFEITALELHKKSRNRTVNVKNFIMNQQIIVGVGNIYVSEALFAAGIHPLKAAGRVSLKSYEKLLLAICRILKRSMDSGGTTISDYKNTKGESGSFQNSLNVYGKGGEPCTKCHRPITIKAVGGRSTFYCPACQR